MFGFLGSSFSFLLFGLFLAFQIRETGAEQIKNIVGGFFRAVIVVLGERIVSQAFVFLAALHKFLNFRNNIGHFKDIQRTAHRFHVILGYGAFYRRRVFGYNRGTIS